MMIFEVCITSEAQSIRVDAQCEWVLSIEK